MSSRLRWLLIHGIVFSGLCWLTFGYESSLQFERVVSWAGHIEEMRALATLSLVLGALLLVLRTLRGEAMDAELPEEYGQPGEEGGGEDELEG